jgi:hypothetical protein
MKFGEVAVICPNPKRSAARLFRERRDARLLSLNVESAALPELICPNHRTAVALSLPSRRRTGMCRGANSRRKRRRALELLEASLDGCTEAIIQRLT